MKSSWACVLILNLQISLGKRRSASATLHPVTLPVIFAGNYKDYLPPLLSFCRTLTGHLVWCKQTVPPCIPNRYTLALTTVPSRLPPAVTIWPSGQDARQLLLEQQDHHHVPDPLPHKEGEKGLVKLP